MIARPVRSRQRVGDGRAGATRGLGPLGGRSHLNADAPECAKGHLLGWPFCMSPARFERATCRLGGDRSIHLSYEDQRCSGQMRRGARLRPLAQNRPTRPRPIPQAVALQPLTAEKQTFWKPLLYPTELQGRCSCHTMLLRLKSMVTASFTAGCVALPG